MLKRQKDKEAGNAPFFKKTESFCLGLVIPLSQNGFCIDDLVIIGQLATTVYNFVTKSSNHR